MALSNWALIDIETTGVHPAEDEIIDLGYYQFQGTTVSERVSHILQKTYHQFPDIEHDF